VRQQDYLMRIIEQVAQALAEVLRLRRLGQFLQALGVVDATVLHYWGLDEQSLDRLDEQQLLELMRFGDVLDTRKTLLLADVLAAAADTYSEMDRPAQAYDRGLKSLGLYLTALLGSDRQTLDSHRPQIEGRLQMLAPYRLPADILGRLFRYYDRAGDFARAEDRLFEWLGAAGDVADRPAERQEARQAGLTFYHRLLTLPDRELIAGGLPRPEVAEGLRELEAG
jgi:hypothetical protein